jgi:CelD/BcsL family acetyltransferase involved in cellulose biosynthesis
MPQAITNSFAVPDMIVTTPAVAYVSEPALTAATDTAFELISHRADFDRLETEWNALFARAGRSAQVFQTFSWNWHWANHYLGSSPGGIAGVELSLVTARRDGKLIMVWPLVAERVRGIRQIFWMGEPVSQYGDVVIDDIPDRMEVMRGAWDFLKTHARGDLLRLRRVRADALIAPLLESLGALASNTQKAPFLDLASAKNFDDYEQRYSARWRRNRRRLLRRLEEQGPVTFERLRKGARARELATKAVAMKSLWLADRGLVSHALSDARMSRFFADAAEARSRDTGCVVSVLSSNGEPAALDVSFACKGRLAMHVIVFNLKFEKAGVGALLTERCLKDAFKEGITTLDMLAPGDNYKLDWADDALEVNDWSQPMSIAGQAYARIYLGFVRDQLKTALASMPQSLRRIVAGGAQAKTTPAPESD